MPDNKNLNVKAEPEHKFSRWPMKAVRILWHFFSSIRLAISLILILVALSLIGALIIQVPAELVRGSAGHIWWLTNVALPRYGAWVGPMEFFQLFDIFRSIWFAGAGFLLVVNIAICGINRWRSISAIIDDSREIRYHEEFYASGNNRAQLYSVEDPAKTGNNLAEALKKRGYRTQSEKSSERLYLSATKNRLSPLGTYLSHFSLILFIAGFLVTSYFGFRDPSFVVIEGMQRKVGHETELSLRLENFNDEYWPDGTPKDYQSEVVLYRDGEEVKRGTIRVNHPLRYQSVRFYQSFFGPAAVIRVQTRDGEALYENGVALDNVLTSNPFQRPAGFFLLSAKGLLVQLIGPAINLDDPSIAHDEVGLELYDQGTATPVAWSKLKKGAPVDVENLRFTYLQDVMYSGFQVSRDPGSTLIWVASVLFLTGISLVFYLPRRQLWAMIRQAEMGSQILVRWALLRGPGRNLEVQKLIAEIQSKLSLCERHQEAGDHD